MLAERLLKRLYALGGSTHSTCRESPPRPQLHAHTSLMIRVFVLSLWWRPGSYVHSDLHVIQLWLRRGGGFFFGSRGRVSSSVVLSKLSTVAEASSADDADSTVADSDPSIPYAFGFLGGGCLFVLTAGDSASTGSAAVLAATASSVALLARFGGGRFFGGGGAAASASATPSAASGIALLGGTVTALTVPTAAARF